MIVDPICEGHQVQVQVRTAAHLKCWIQVRRERKSQCVTVGRPETEEKLLRRFVREKKKPTNKPNSIR